MSLNRRIEEKFSTVVQHAKWWRDGQPPCAVIETKSDPRLGLAGDPEAWSVWEHGLLVVGWVNLDRAARRAGKGYPDMPLAFAETLAEFGTSKASGSEWLRILSTARYMNGAGPLTTAGLEGNQYTVADGSGVQLWVEPALLWLSRTSPATFQRATARKVVGQRGLEEAKSSRGVAEWLAVVRPDALRAVEF